MKNISYHWIVWLCACGMIAASSGLGTNSAGVFYQPVSEGLGVLRGSIALYDTLCGTTTAVFSLFVPKILSGKNFKKILIAGVLGSGISASLMAVCSELWQFYLLGIIRGICTSFYGVVAAFLLLGHWFKEKYGLANSTMMVFAGISGAVFAPLLNKVINLFGWRTAYPVFGGLIVLLCLPAILMPFTLYPEDMGMRAYGDTGEVKTPRQRLAEAGPVSFGAVTAATAFMLLTMIPTAMPGHLAALASDKGILAGNTALMMTACMIGNIASKVFYGSIADRIGAPAASALILFLNAAGVLLLIFGETSGWLLAGAVLFGMVNCVASSGTGLIVRDLAGPANYDKVYPPVYLAGKIALSLSGSVYGYLHDFSGGYLSSLWIIFVMVLTALGLMVWMHFRMKKNKEKAI